MEEIHYTIGESAAGMRADKLLRRLLPGVPLSHIYKMLRKGRAKVEKRRLRPADRLEAGDVVRLFLAESDAAAVQQRLSADAAPRKAAVALPILYRDEHIVAFDKPAGVAAHPGSGHPEENTVLGALLALAGDTGPLFTPALVGRLDRDASGVQLAGLSAGGMRGLSQLVLERKLSKTYTALVKDNGLPRRGRIDTRLSDRRDGRARMEVSAEGELEAVTEYRVLARASGAALVEVRLGTGRRHQIRAHFASIGAPLAGDVRYGDRGWNLRLRRAGIKRLFLHCSSAEFIHPMTGRRITIESPLPRELAAPLKRLGFPHSRQ